MSRSPSAPLLLGITAGLVAAVAILPTALPLSWQLDAAEREFTAQGTERALTASARVLLREKSLPGVTGSFGADFVWLEDGDSKTDFRNIPAALRAERPDCDGVARLFEADDDTWSIACQQISDERMLYVASRHTPRLASNLALLITALAVIVGIIDRAGGIIAPEGLSFEEVTHLFEAKQGNSLNASDMLSFEDVNARIWDLEADVFLPCAASRLITQDQLNRMVKAGVEVISSGANVPFADDEIFYGPIAESADGQLAVVPDFIANCGMARVFAYLMSESDVDLSDEAIFSDTSATIERALQETHGKNQGQTGLAATAFEIALSKLMPAHGN